MLPKKKILVIDDDETVFLLLRKRLGHRYDLVTTTDPDGALSLALREQPDLILCDICMPWVNGGDLSGQFFECEGTRRLPFAYLTALLSPANMRDRSGLLGTRHGISKATPTEEMVRMIEQLLR